MKLNVISDLHCLPSRHENDRGFHTSWFGFEPEKLEPADYLVVAGDMGVFENHVDVIKELRLRTEGKFKDILWIRGNHDYWVDETTDWFAYSDEDLERPTSNKTIDLVDGDVAFVGTTLWTNSCKMSETERMNDYRYIPGFDPALKIQRFSEESNWLRGKWEKYRNEGKKVVLITHHNPRSAEQLPENSWDHADVYTAYWTVNNVLDDVKPDLWICGHIHETFDGDIDGVRFVRHPIGYRWSWYAFAPQTNKSEWYNKIVEI